MSDFATQISGRSSAHGCNHPPPPPPPPLFPSTHTLSTLTVGPPPRLVPDVLLTIIPRSFLTLALSSSVFFILRCARLINSRIQRKRRDRESAARVRAFHTLMNTLQIQCTPPHHPTLFLYGSGGSDCFGVFSLKGHVLHTFTFIVMSVFCFTVTASLQSANVAAHSWI